MVNSRAKGVAGEREWRDFLRERGFSDARRGRQFSGSPESPDVRCGSLPGIHWEVKRVQALNLDKALLKANEDVSKFGDANTDTPIVAYRRNGENWKVTLWADDFFEMFIAGYLAGRNAAK